jgi:hypothetical protein
MCSQRALALTLAFTMRAREWAFAIAENAG